METFGKRLKAALEKKKLKAADLNRILNRPVRNTAVYEWLNDRAKPLADELVKVSTALDVSVDWLLMGKDLQNNQIPETQLIIEKNEYIDFLNWKNTKLQSENNALKRSSESIHE